MKKNIIFTLTSIFLVFSIIFSLMFSVSAEDVEIYSKEYQSSVYYQRLIKALEENAEKTTMEKTLAIALSQEGYLNYATTGIDIEKAKADGKIWTGTELRMNENLTGNTEYTRWAQRYIMGRDEESSYADFDWCAIFVSWCLFQAGYYSQDLLKKYYYSYFADPRIFYDADSWIESFNFLQKNVYYVPKAHHKLDAMDWNTYYNVDVDPYDIPYKPGGILFVSWDTSGQYFDHVSIVVDYDKETHVLKYTNGNSDGQVITREMDLDVEESFHGNVFAKNAERIMGYAEYDGIKPLAPKQIKVENPTIIWDKSSSSGIKIKTDSDSVMASVYLDGEYSGSVIESNMVFHEGLLSIGKSEIQNLNLGTHKLRVKFEDGSADILLHITDKENVSLGTYGDVNQDTIIDILDVTCIQEWLANLKVSSFNLLAADVNLDQKANISDATEIQLFLAELSTNENIGKEIK